MLDKPEILIIDDEEDIKELLRHYLQKDYKLCFASNGEEAFQILGVFRPNLIILDIILKGMDGFKILSRLKSDIINQHIPVIMITAKSDLQSKIECLEKGAIDYIIKPFDPSELQARIKAHIRQFQLEFYANPLTGLPGNVPIELKLKKLVQKQEKFAAIFIDIDNFKAFNDKFGYDTGDKALLLVKNILLETKINQGCFDDFLGHIGGDDFVYISTPENMEKICNFIISRFDELVRTLYPEEDRNRGYIETINRRGVIERFPIMTLSIAVITNLLRRIEDYREIPKIYSELKTKLKTMQGSKFLVDQRKGNS